MIVLVLCAPSGVGSAWRGILFHQGAATDDCAVLPSHAIIALPAPAGIRKKEGCLLGTTFSRTMACDKPVTRELVLSLAALLRRLAAAECGCFESELGGGITLYRGPDAMRFETPEELSAAVPPLEPLDAFRMTFFCNPFPRPGEQFVSLFAGMEPGGSMQITASAASTVRAQELGLEIADSLPGLSSSLKPCDTHDPNHGGNSDQRHNDKFRITRQTAAFIVAAIGLVSSIVTIALAWPDILGFFSRLLHIQQ